MTVTRLPPVPDQVPDTLRGPTGSQLRHARSARGWRGTAIMLGPAFVAAVGYIDPGNFATNIASGARYGFLLVWVVVLASLMAMLVQYLSAKAGIATGMSLPELCRRHFPRRTSFALWVQAEIVAIATDLAEFVGAAIALRLLFGVPPLAAGLMTAVVAFAILALQTRGYRRFELAVTALLGIVFMGFVYDVLAVGVDPTAWLSGLRPAFEGDRSLLLAAGILGATVMPHVVYLHSAMTATRIPGRDLAERRELVRYQRVDVICAMGLSGVLNVILLVLAATAFHGVDSLGGDAIIGAHAGFERLVGGGAALAFAVALLASGLSSSSVGTYAGQVIMQGFIDRQIPLFVRRAITMAPSLLILGLGVSATDALLLSQVVLSFGIPFALVPLVLLTRRRDVMGGLVNTRWTTRCATAVTGVIIALNVVLLVKLAT